MTHFLQGCTYSNKATPPINATPFFLGGGTFFQTYHHKYWIPLVSFKNWRVAMCGLCLFTWFWHSRGCLKWGRHTGHLRFCSHMWLKSELCEELWRSSFPSTPSPVGMRPQLLGPSRSHVTTTAVTPWCRRLDMPGLGTQPAPGWPGCKNQAP